MPNMAVRMTAFAAAETSFIGSSGARFGACGPGMYGRVL